MDCNNGSILSKIEMTNYSKLRVEHWSISYCTNITTTWQPASNHTGILLSRMLPQSVFWIWFDYNLGLALSLFNMSSKLTQSYEDNLIVENQTNSFLFSNLLNNHHRNNLPFVKGVSNSNYIPDSYFYRILKRVWIHLHNVPPFSFLDINMFCSNNRTINIYDFW